MQEFNFAFKAQHESQDLPRDIFYLAQGFYLAGNRCALNIEVGPGVTQSLTSPSVVNYCFSIELFFKALVRYDEGRRVKGHELNKLFAELQPKRQDAIRAKYESIIQTPSFDHFMGDVGDYFNRIRYEFENTVELFYDGPIALLAKMVYTYSAQVLEQAPTLSPLDP